MGIKKVTYVRFVFDRAKFARDVKAVAKDSNLALYEIDAMIGVKFTNSMGRENWFPTMRNYLSICNSLDLNANDYIVIREDALPF